MNAYVVADVYQNQFAQYLKLPFTDGREMVFALPSDFAPPDPKRITDVLASHVKFSREAIAISIPRFTFNEHLDLIETLVKGGVSNAFSTRTADFRPMFGNKHVALTDIYQESEVTVDEQGAREATVSAAFVEIGMTPGLAMNRPFAFIIDDPATQGVLAAGIVTHP